MTGPFGHNSRWYWFYAAAAAGVAMLVAMFLIAVHPSRRRAGRAPETAEGAGPNGEDDTRSP